MAWFPMFLIEQFDINSNSSAICTALIILVNIPGNLLGGRLNKIYLRPSKILRIATVIMFSCIIGIFSVKLSPVICVLFAIVFSFFAGMVPATLFATVPIFSSSITQLGGANGMLFQGSALGQLLGSPIVAVFVTYGNGKWEYAVVPLLLFSIIQFLLSSSLRSTGH
jgi:MFS family permease